MLQTGDVTDSTSRPFGVSRRAPEGPTADLRRPAAGCGVRARRHRLPTARGARASAPRHPGGQCPGRGLRDKRRARHQHLAHPRPLGGQPARRGRAARRSGGPIRRGLLDGGRGVHLDAGADRAVPARDRTRASGAPSPPGGRAPRAREDLREPGHLPRARRPGRPADDVRPAAGPRDPRPRGARHPSRLARQARFGGCWRRS